MDRRRLAAAGLSAVLPGLGQAFDRHPRLAALFAGPSLVLLLLAILIVQLQSAARLVAWIVTPQVLGALLALNVLVFCWRLVSVGQAFLDTSRQGPTGRRGFVGIVIIALLVALPHLVVFRYGTVLGETFAQVFEGAGFADDAGIPPGPVPRTSATR